MSRALFFHSVVSVWSVCLSNRWHSPHSLLPPGIPVPPCLSAMNTGNQTCMFKLSVFCSYFLRWRQCYYFPFYNTIRVIFSFTIRLQRAPGEFKKASSNRLPHPGRNHANKKWRPGLFFSVHCVTTWRQIILYFLHKLFTFLTFFPVYSCVPISFFMILVKSPLFLPLSLGGESSVTFFFFF